MEEYPTRYLKNASARKDAEGDYWLFIESSKGRAMFCLSECMDLDADEHQIIKQVLDSWLVEQDSGNGKAKK